MSASQAKAMKKRNSVRQSVAANGGPPGMDKRRKSVSNGPMNAIGEAPSSEDAQKLLGLDNKSGHLLESFSCTVLVAKETVGRSGSLYIFQSVIGFYSKSLYRDNFSFTLPHKEIASIKCVSMQSIEICALGEINTISFPYLNRSNAFTALVNYCGLKETVKGKQAESLSDVKHKKGSLQMPGVMEDDPMSPRAAAIPTMEDEEEEEEAKPGFFKRMFGGGDDEDESDSKYEKMIQTTKVIDQVEKVLFVHVHAATNLQPADDDTSDPYVVVKLGRLKGTTQVIYKTLDPDFDEIFVFPLNSVDLANDSILFYIFDKDIAFDDSLGYAKMSLRKLVGSENEASEKKKKKQFGNLKLVESPEMKEPTLLEQINPFRTKVDVTGELEVSVWVGTRHDTTMMRANRAGLSDTADFEERTGPIEKTRVKAYLEPGFCLLRVSVKEAMDLLACDFSGLSDPYVQLTVNGCCGEQTQFTKYLNDTINPVWNEEFTFLLMLPLHELELEVAVYDYDVGYDELIGKVAFPVKDLPVNKGMTDPPKPKVFTLMNDGEDCDSSGTKLGQIRMAAWVDFEYLNHPQGSPGAAVCGTVIIDIVRATSMIEPGKYFVLAMFEGVWARVRESRLTDKPEWGQRMIFPCTEPSSTLMLGVFDMNNYNKLVGKIRIRVSSLSGNKQYAKNIPMYIMDDSEASCIKTGNLAVKVTFKYDTVLGIGPAVMAKYIEPTLPVKNYLRPLPAGHSTLINKLKMSAICEHLALSDPPIPIGCAQEILDFNETTFNIRIVKANIERMKAVGEMGAGIGEFVVNVISWKNPFVTSFAVVIGVIVVLMPSLVLPSIMLGLFFITIATSFNAQEFQYDHMGMNPSLSLGEPLVKVAPADPVEEEEVVDLGPPEPESGDIAAEKSWDPFASLTAKYNELVGLAEEGQTNLVTAANLIESIVNLFSWHDPRVTWFVMVGTFAGFVALMLFDITLLRIQIGMAAGLVYAFKPPLKIFEAPEPEPAAPTIPETLFNRVPTLRDRIIF